jgi:hypothetical protein
MHLRLKVYADLLAKDRRAAVSLKLFADLHLIVSVRYRPLLTVAALCGTRRFVMECGPSGENELSGAGRSAVPEAL